MRILIINPFAGGEAEANENIDLIKEPDTEYDIVNISDGYPLKNNQWLYFKHACTGPTLDKVEWAEAQGYDAVFISCQLDIGLYEARTLVDIPVTGTLESAALLCATMGKHFTLLSVDYQNGEIQRSLLKLYGLDTNLKSIIPIDIDANDLYPGKTSHETIIERVMSGTRRALDEGAEMVIPGCTLFGSILTHQRAVAGLNLPLPVVDGMSAGFKLAEMRARLNAAGVLPAVSRVGYFMKPPADQMKILKDFKSRT
jgi:Asp/Glu/hydantoin racemase